MKRYLIRVLKTIVYFLIITSLMLVVIALMSKKVTSGDYSLLLKDRGFIHILYFVGFVSLFYPLFAYAKKKVYLNRNFTEDRKFIEELLASAKYELVKEEPTKLYFRPTSKLYRLMRMFEDTVTIDYTEGTILELEGMRKDVFRLARYIERFAEKS